MPANFLLFKLREAIQYRFLERKQKLRAVGRYFLDSISTTHAQGGIGGFKSLKQHANQLRAFENGEHCTIGFPH